MGAATLTSGAVPIKVEVENELALCTRLYVGLCPLGRHTRVTIQVDLRDPVLLANFKL